MTLLLDVHHLCEHHTNDALEYMFKAAAGDPPDDSIWNPHESPYISTLIELFTSRGLTRIAGVREELDKWLAGEMQRGGKRLARPVGEIERWTTGELQLMRLYLQSVPPAEFTLDDRMMLVDYLIQRYLPYSDLRTEAEWLAVRTTLMGQVEARATKLTKKQADKIAAALPSTVQQAADVMELSPSQVSALDYARVRGAENVRRFSDNARHRLRTLVLDHSQQQMTAPTGVPDSALQTKLQDEFGAMNRDWRRIAITEAGENANQGMVASIAPGEKLKRVERYSGACPFCRKIDGQIMEVVSSDAPDKDGDRQIWAGKTNVGRAAAPRKRIGGTLVPREPDEMWWIAAGVQHPHCRGRWVRVVEDGDQDAAFIDQLSRKLRG